MEKNTEKKEVKLSEEAQFEILSKKIICKFYQNSLFTRLCHIGYEGQVMGWGDAVRFRDHTMLTVDRGIPIEEKHDPEIFKNMQLLDLVTEKIAKQLQEQVEKVIVGVGRITDGRSLYFVGAIVPMGGYSPRDYKMRFVYGFKIK